MKNLMLLLMIFSPLLFITSCRDESPQPEVLPDFERTEKSLSLVESNNKFGFNLFQKTYEELSGNEKNILQSPFSIALALGMVYNGAEGETKSAIEETLQMNGLTTDEINTVYQSLSDYLCSVDPLVDFKVANSIWCRNTLDILQPFIDVNSTYYNAEVSALDFDDPSAKNTINNWVAENTEDKITEIIDNISPNDLMFLINALYF